MIDPIPVQGRFDQKKSRNLLILFYSVGTSSYLLWSANKWLNQSDHDCKKKVEILKGHLQILCKICISKKDLAIYIKLKSRPYQIVLKFQTILNWYDGTFKQKRPSLLIFFTMFT